MGRDNAILDASFLFADFQEEECPTQNIPLCKASPLPSPQEVRFGRKDSLQEEEEGVVEGAVTISNPSHLSRCCWPSSLPHSCHCFHNCHQTKATFRDTPCPEKLEPGGGDRVCAFLALTVVI